jgi:glycosidase
MTHATHWLVLSALVLLSANTRAQTVTLSQRDATVWGQEQTVRGTLNGATSGTLFVNGEQIPFETTDDRFAVPVVLGEGESEIVACAANVCSDPLTLTLGYELRPEVYLFATVTGREVTFEGHVLANPDGGDLTFAWEEDPDNPQPLDLAVLTDATAAASVPDGAAPGEYYVNLTATDTDGDAVRARTFVTVSAEAVTPFDIEQDHAAWIHDAVIYEISPFYFQRSASSRFLAIQERLPELADLGVNTIWLQPITPTANGGQAYDVIDYFGIWSTLGTEEQLRSLIATAHGLGMRVLFDIVPNHTSIEHPYAEDAIAHGEASHYYDFYQRAYDDVPYSQHYNQRSDGEMTFVYYFWEDLVNLDYHNPEVRRHLIEAGRYWVEEFDIDGYRIDAVWGVNARNPEFMQEWRLALKRVKPEVLLLGEDKATRPEVFDRRFDAAYDWYPEESWVSHWTWEVDFSTVTSRTIFNYAPEGTRSLRLRASLTNQGNGWAEDAKVLRFMENNDTFRFIDTHDLARTKMAGALLFSLPGIPLLYNGQEIGHRSHPYSTYTIFGSGTIASQDDEGLVPYYGHLLWLRATFPALTSDHFAELPVSPASVAARTFAYRRWAEQEDENLFAVINMGAAPRQAELELPVGDLGVEPDETYVLTDLFSGEPQELTGAELEALSVEIPGYTTRLFALADSTIVVPVSSEPDGLATPASSSLAQNYPNPFQSSTSIEYELAETGLVRLNVYDVLGREVAVLVDEHQPAGAHQVRFDAAALPSGVYVYRLSTGGRTHTQRMALVR